MGGWTAARLAICRRAARKLSSGSPRLDPRATAVLMVAHASRLLSQRAPPGNVALPQPEHILHGIKPRRLVDNPSRCAQRPTRKNFAACCTMHQLKALTGATKNYGVLTNHIAFANRLNRNFVLNSLRR